MKSLFLALAPWILAFATYTPLAHSGVQDIEDCGIGLDTLAKDLNDVQCSQDELHFKACLEAVQTLLKFSDPPSRLETVDPGTKTDLGTFGPVRVARRKNLLVDPVQLALNLEQAVKDAKKLKEAESSRWRELFSDRFTRPVPFDRLLDWVRSQLGDPRKAAQAAYFAYWNFREYLEYGPTSGIYRLKIPTTAHSDSLIADQVSGIRWRSMAGLPMVQTVFPKSVAEDAGIRPKDLITDIDGTSTLLLSSAEMVDLLSPEAGNPVALGIVRGKQVLRLTLRPEARFRKLVESELLNPPSPAGYLRLLTFMDHHACAKVREAIETFAQAGAQGLVLDLRGNLGGLLDEALCIVRLFVGDHRLILTEKRIGSEAPDAPYRANQRALTDLPLVVLIDNTSASASELVAGTLQDMGRAWVIGERSWGKGTVLRGVEIEEDSPVFLNKVSSVYHYPSGRTSQGSGVYPDFEAYATGRPSARERIGTHAADTIPRLAPGDASPWADATAWTQPRAREIRKIERCLRRHGIDPDARDYPLEAGLRVLECSSL